MLDFKFYLCCNSQFYLDGIYIINIYLSFSPLPPLTCPPSHSPLSPASPPPRLTGGQALPKSRECCPRLGLGFGLLLPHPPLFKHLPASENIPHCLSSRDGGDLSQNVSIAKDNTLENGLKKYFVLNCGWVVVKSPKLFSDKTVSCSYGIFDHSKHIIFS